MGGDPARAGRRGEPYPGPVDHRDGDAAGVLGLSHQGRRGRGQGHRVPRRRHPGQDLDRRGVPHHHPAARRSDADSEASREGRALRRQTRRDARLPRAAAAVDAALRADDRHLDFRHAPDAERRRTRRRDGVRQVTRQAAGSQGGPRHLRRCRGHRRGARRAAGDRRVSQGSAEVQPAGWQDPQGRAARRPAGHRQDAAGARHRGRGERAVLQHLGLRLCRDVRRCRRQPRSRHVRSGEKVVAVHHLHR